MIQFKCVGQDCSKPWANVYNGVLLVYSRHGGQAHTNAIALTELVSILDASAEKNRVWSNVFGLSPLHFVRPALIQLPVLEEPVRGMELVCHVAGCERPWAYAIDGRLYVESNHDERHINSVAVNDLRKIFGKYLAGK